MSQNVLGKAAAYYNRRWGFQIVPIAPSSKRPTSRPWQLHASEVGETHNGKPVIGPGLLRTEGEVRAHWSSSPQANIALRLGTSGMVSLDIDDLDAWAIICDNLGIESSDLEGFPCIQGDSSGMRYLFRAPQGSDLTYHKMSWPTKADPKKSYGIFELRADAADGTARFDLLPPSIHPDTREPYRWLTPPDHSWDYSDWPEPPAWLLALWDAWDDLKPQISGMCPWATEQEPKAPRPKRPDISRSESVIDAYCAAVTIDDALRRYGYTRTPSGRYLSPHSSTGLAGVVVDRHGGWTDRVHIHHASDPLNDGNGTPVNAFDMFAHYEHSGDLRAAARAAAIELGIDHKTVRERERAESRSAQLLAGVRQEQAESATDIDVGTKSADAPDAKQTVTKPTKRTVDPMTLPPRPLGHGDASDPGYYYYSYAREQVVRLTAAEHTERGLQSMAGFKAWLGEYPNDEGTRPMWKVAGASMMERCHGLGVYDDQHERSTGVWTDDGRIVVHLGSKALVDGVPARLHEIETDHVYQRTTTIPYDATALPATDEERQRFLNLVGRFPWASEGGDTHAALAAGWCAITIICGILRFRPMLHIGGGTGSGKSSFIQRVAQTYMGPFLHNMSGSVTEAAMRQSLASRALPVAWDESEAKNQRAAQRVEDVLFLLRTASDENSAPVVKGSPSGRVQRYRVRTVAVLGSINSSMEDEADRNRFIRLQLDARRHDDPDGSKWSATERELDWLEEAAPALRTYSIRHAADIRESATVFSEAVRSVYEESGRTGAVFGSPLAAWYHLRHGRAATRAEAVEAVKTLALEPFFESSPVDSDENSCMRAILGHHVRTETVDGAPAGTRTLGRVLIDRLSTYDAKVLRSSKTTLGVNGMRVRGDYLYVGRDHGSMRRILDGTPWGRGQYYQTLRRMDGATTGEPKQMSIEGVRCSVVKIPLTSIYPDLDEEIARAREDKLDDSGENEDDQLPY